jgi:hypothetical protein
MTDVSWSSSPVTVYGHIDKAGSIMPSTFHFFYQDFIVARAHINTCRRHCCCLLRPLQVYHLYLSTPTIGEPLYNSMLSDVTNMSLVELSTYIISS